jgi:TatD DNase family protein
MGALVVLDHSGVRASGEDPRIIHDTHCHLGMYRDRQGVIDRANASSVEIVCSTVRPSEYRDSMFLRAQPSVTVGIGFHPEYAGSVYVPHEQAIFDGEIEKARWVSEVGLDAVIAGSVSPHFGEQPTMTAQIALFEYVLSRARDDQPLSVHSRGAAETTIDLLDAHDKRRVVLHRFDGTRDQAARALDRGYYFSINPAVLDDSAARELITRLPIEWMLLETDGPYFPFGDRAREPSDLRLFVEDLAELRKEEAGMLHKQIAANFDRLIND